MGRAQIRTVPQRHVAIRAQQGSNNQQHTRSTDPTLTHSSLDRQPRTAHTQCEVTFVPRLTLTLLRRCFSLLWQSQVSADSVPTG